jgi:aryl-alcohol dehydrogenase
MAARVAGCTTIVAIDLHDSRLELAREVGATHTINSGTADMSGELSTITGGEGVNYILDTTGVPAVVSGAAGALSIRGTLALVGASAPGTKVSVDIDVASLLKGWTLKTIVQGSSVPQVFIPSLIELWKQGRFPVDKLVRTYKLDDINSAFTDSESGATVKPVVLY